MPTANLSSFLLDCADGTGGNSCQLSQIHIPYAQNTNILCDDTGDCASITVTMNGWTTQPSFTPCFVV